MGKSKGWKRIQEGRVGAAWDSQTKRGSQVSILKGVSKFKGRWSGRLFKNHKLQKEVDFNSRTAAMKWAVQYMRRHPHG